MEQRKTKRFKFKKYFSFMVAMLMLVIGTSAFATAPTEAPTVSVSNVSSNSVTLTWNAVTNASEYNVYKDGVKIGTTSSTSYTVTGLVEGQSYTFEVAGSDGTTEGPKSTATTVVAGQAGLYFNFNFQEMFSWANTILQALMPVVYITMGVSLAFLIVAALKRAFS